MDAIFTRTSVRSYENRPVEDEKIGKILRAAMAAPSAMNQQPWEFYVVTNKSTLRQLSEASPYAGMTAEAPAALVLCYRKTDIKVPELVDVDMSLATENILLEIEALGLGGVMLGIAPFEERMAKVAKKTENNVTTKNSNHRVYSKTNTYNRKQNEQGDRADY